MSKSRTISVTLLNPGYFSRNWWQPNKNTFFPIHVGQRTKVHLNGFYFYINIVCGNKESPFFPGYVCETDTMCSLKEASPTAAISNIYQELFKTQSRYSGTLVIGWNDESIVEKLSTINSFSPITIALDELKIFVYSIGSTSQQLLKNGGPGFQSSFYYKYKNKSSLFVSKIEENICIVEIYQNFELVNCFEGKSPIEVWEKAGVLQKYDGYQRFGLNEPLVQKLIRDHKIPTCTPDNWNEFSLMEPLYKYYLKKRSLANIEWHKLFIQWSQKGSTIIELFSELENIYPKNYELKDREKSAWKAFLHAAGCHNITPWTQEESMVNFLRLAFYSIYHFIIR